MSLRVMVGRLVTTSETFVCPIGILGMDGAFGMDSFFVRADCLRFSGHFKAMKS